MLKMDYEKLGRNDKIENTSRIILFKRLIYCPQLNCYPRNLEFISKYNEAGYSIRLEFEHYDRLVGNRYENQVR
jgi:hypothetical protein